MTVYSRIHMLCENIVDDSESKAMVNAHLEHLKNSPTFVIQADAFELMGRADCGAAVQALFDADILRLPHPMMVVEWCTRQARVNDLDKSRNEERFKQWEPLHEFVHLTEQHDAKLGHWGLVCEYSFMFAKTRVGGIYNDRFAMAPDKDGIKAIYQKNIPPNLRDIALGASLIAMNVALVLMNMRGIEREIHTFAALNKQRIKRHKPIVSQYTYLRIGHVYRSDGTVVKYIDGDNRHMPMHVRTAHTRRQHFGKNNEETKLIYVPSCIVNFDPTGELKVPKQKVIKA